MSSALVSGSVRASIGWLVLNVDHHCSVEPFAAVRRATVALECAAAFLVLIVERELLHRLDRAKGCGSSSAKKHVIHLQVQLCGSHRHSTRRVVATLLAPLPRGVERGRACAPKKAMRGRASDTVSTHTENWWRLGAQEWLKKRATPHLRPQTPEHAQGDALASSQRWAMRRGSVWQDAGRRRGAAYL